MCVFYIRVIVDLTNATANGSRCKINQIENSDMSD